MSLRRALVILLSCFLFVAVGCSPTSIAEQEQIKNIATIRAGTPSPTLPPTITPTPTSTPTLTPTVGPSPTPQPPTATPLPSPTPLPPTPTPNPALADYTLCTQNAGDVSGGRFSTRTTGITATIDSVAEHLTIGLRVASDSVPPHATARCLSDVDAVALSGEARNPGKGYVLQIDLDSWIHDDLFRASVANATTSFKGTTVIKSVSYRFNQSAPAGATMVINLSQPLPFRLKLVNNPTRLVLDVAKTSPINQSSDTLSQPSSGGARSIDPLVFLRDGDIWKFADGKATNLTKSPETETSLAVNLDAGVVAFCRAAPGVDLNDVRATSTLWTMKIDGSNVQEIAPDVRTCAEPTFSPDGKTIALVVNETGATPQRLSIFTVPASGGDARRVTPADDEWSRFGPQWLDNNRLIYAAAAEDGRSTLFISGSKGGEEDVGAALVVDDRYRRLGRPFVSRDGKTIAVEGLRASKDGTDLILLDGNGVEQDTIADKYWVRPVAWNSDGTLFYLKTACASSAVQDYTLYAHAKGSKVSDDHLLAAGVTTGGYGRFVSVSDGLAYVALAHVPSGPRGPFAIDPSSASALWFWDITGGTRVQLVDSPSAISDLAP